MHRIGLRKGKKRAIHTLGNVKKTPGGYELRKMFDREVFGRLTTNRRIAEGDSWIIIRPFLGAENPFVLSKLDKHRKNLAAFFERDKEKFEILLDNRGRARNLKEGKKYMIDIVPWKNFFELYEQMPLGRGRRAEPEELRAARIKNFKEMCGIERGYRVLDAATGVKEYLKYFDRVGRLFCLNISSAVLEITKNWLKSSSAVFVVYDAEQGFPFKEGTFDCIIIDALLEYVHDPRRIIRSAGRIVKDGGIMLILMPIESGKIEDFYPQDLWEVALWRPKYDPFFNEEVLEETLREERFELVEKREMRFQYPIYNMEDFSQPLLKVQKSFIG
jgi:SAM-dependent methyltransferase